MTETSSKRSDAILASGPTGGAPSGRLPIGVPPDYAVSTDKPANYVELNAPMRQIPPRYFEGYQFTPATWRADEIADLQRAMDGAGIYTPGTRYERGIFDEPDLRAFTKLLTFANAAGITYDQAIRRWANEGMGEVETNPGPLPPKVVRLTNPAEIRAVFKKAALDSLGYSEVDPADLDRMVAAYQAEESRVQSAIHTASAAGSGTTSTVTDAPSLETFADQKIREMDPVGYDAHSALDGFDMVAQFMRGAA